MKIIARLNILIFSIGLFASCATQPETSQYSGKADITDIEDNSWFIKKYESYHPTPKYINTLKNLPLNIQIIAFGATWDENSKKTLPELYKLADKAKIADDQIVLYLLDKDLRSEDMAHSDYNIKSIPTFIILKDGKEISRLTGIQEGTIAEQLTESLPSGEKLSSTNN